jgi:chromosome segregation ATPase
MKRYGTTILITTLLVLVVTAPLRAEVRREGGGNDALRKAQYMLRQLNQENQELKARNAELQASLDELGKKQEETGSQLDKVNDRNNRLAARISSDADKFRELMLRYRETVQTLREANQDNSYLVKAVEEREAWIDQCRSRNDGLFEANSDLLQRYGKLAGKKSDPITGIGKVKVENEVQEYRFRLEDLQTREFKSSVDVNSHTLKQLEESGMTLN